MSGYLVAGAPFVVAGAALLWLRWSAVRAGIATLVTAVAGALLWPGLERDGLRGAVFDGIGTSWQVLYVLFGGQRGW